MRPFEVLACVDQIPALSANIISVPKCGVEFARPALAFWATKPGATASEVAGCGGDTDRGNGLRPITPGAGHSYRPSKLLRHIGNIEHSTLLNESPLSQSSSHVPECSKSKEPIYSLVQLLGVNLRQPHQRFEGYLQLFSSDPTVIPAHRDRFHDHSLPARPLPAHGLDGQSCKVQGLVTPQAWLHSRV